MPSFDSHASPFTPARPRRSQPASVTSYLPTHSASSQPFLADAFQPGFSFSVEPAAMDYSSSSVFASATTPADSMSSVFTPNTTSSYDSLHPDVLGRAFAQHHAAANANFHVNAAHLSHAQQQALSTASNSLSPPQSLRDHVSPARRNDSAYGLSQYTTPAMLQEPFGSLLRPNDSTGGAMFNPPFADNNPHMHMPLVNADMTAYSPEPAVPVARSETQLLSPCPTSHSPEETPHLLPSAHADTECRPPSSPSPACSRTRTASIKKEPSPSSRASPGTCMAHLTSPIVRVQNWEESSTRSERPASKRSQGSHRSGNHLSPFPEHGSDDEDAPRARQQPVPATAERSEDGAWLASDGSRQTGLSPDERQAIKEAWVPSIDELAENRHQAEKNAEVREWLTKSEVGSEAGDGGSSALLKPRFVGRRRAKSHNDAHARHGAMPELGLVSHLQFNDSSIPGPGIYINEGSDDDEGEEDDEPESPPAQIDVNATDTDNPYFPPATAAGTGKSAGTVRPWNDAPAVATTPSARYQPPTSNAAMMRFRQRAKDVESASLAATVGSRRLSESDLGSVRAAPGVSKAAHPDKKHHHENRQRRPSFLDSILPRRTNNNLLKRKGSHPTPPPPLPTVHTPPVPTVHTPPEGGPERANKDFAIEKPKRMGSWGRPKSPRLGVDTNLVGPARDLGSSSGANLTASPWVSAKNVIKRTRSRSDLGKSPGLMTLMTQHGGPPMPMLASPLADTEATRQTPAKSPDDGDDDDDDAHEAVTMDLKVRSDPIIPSYEGFKTHARQLNPRLAQYMVERITQEQMRRYKRLLEFRVRHLNVVQNRNCSSTSFCTALGGASRQLAPRAGNKDAETPFVGFQITAHASSDDEAAPEGSVVSAQFPSGVPPPAVKRLPAEFECPLCFKVKKFYKPSDWTKHVHEDVQPFTCTFPNCGEPKSFKRKADWVRHENERHRQLENWTCCIADCNHTCYRKDNFVQHLVREHKIAEPRARPSRAGGARDAAGDGDDIWSLVEKCRRDTAKQPKDEPCRFCGNICTSWKKLTVHLAKHMEQISMPILPLVAQKQLNADTVISPMVESPEHTRRHRSLTTPGKSPEHASRYLPGANASATPAPTAGPAFFAPDAVQGSFMQPYSRPPLSGMQPPTPAADYVDFSAHLNVGGRSYPGLAETPKAQVVYSAGYANGSAEAGDAFAVPMLSQLGQAAPAVLTSSPVESTFPAACFTQEPQQQMGLPMAYGAAANAAGYAPSAGFAKMSFLPQQQHQPQQQQQQQQHHHHHHEEYHFQG